MTAGDQLYDVLRRIRPVHELSARAVADVLTGSDITVPMRAVLERLHDGGPQTVPAIAQALLITRQGVQSLVDEARRLGYVESRPNPRHRRSHLIALTGRGRSSYERIHARELGNLDRIAAELDPREVEACVRVLDQLVAGLAATTSTTTEGPTS